MCEPQEGCSRASPALPPPPTAQPWPPPHPAQLSGLTSSSPRWGWTGKPYPPVASPVVPPGGVGQIDGAALEEACHEGGAHTQAARPGERLDDGNLALKGGGSDSA